jgi:hypothetical protein
MLRSAGQRGVRSDAFFSAHMPRGAARIKDLKDQGYEITSEREGKFCRYRLESVGVGGGFSREGIDSLTTVNSGVAAAGQHSPAGPAAPPEFRQVPPARSVPSMFDADADWSAA